VKSLEVRIRALVSEDSVASLTALLHRSYRELAKQGLNFSAADQTPDDTMRRLRQGECFVAIAGDTVVGTILLIMPGRKTRVQCYNRVDVAHFGQFAVEPDLQREGIGDRLLSHVENRARTAGMRELALDTAAGATDLIGYYTRRGYRRVDKVRWDGKTYESVVLSKRLVDE